ncbi:MAG TPA: outer membrane beta-barrel protein [Chthoniobacterales bacterium]|nr:outer membrane beta-barrel protein [Chthoniobacterales bacterium]
MNRLFALTVGFFALVAVSRLFGGPEPLPSGKEMKQVAPAPAPMCDWTGLYIGLNAGYGETDMTWSDTDTVDAFGSTVGTDNSGPTTLADHRESGFLMGGQFGYNYQWRWLVLGAEGTFDYSHVRAHTVKGLRDEPNVFDTQSDWLGTIALRVGVTYNRFLFYAKGGAAFVHEKYIWLHGESDDQNRTSEGQIDDFRTDEVRTGALVGGGVEYAINCNWSAKIEYNHLFLGTDNISGTRIDGGVAEAESFQTDLDMDTLQLGLNYKFWSLGGNRSPSLTFSGVERLEPKEMAAPPPVERACNWTGLYIGAHLGYGAGDLIWIDNDDPSEAPELMVEHDQRGFFSGGQLGYNYQIGSYFVVGGEGEFSYSEIVGHSDNKLDGSPDIYDTRNDWTGTIAGRAGVTLWHFLAYGKGGAAFSHEKYSWLHGVPDDNKVEPFHADDWQTAPMVGGGVEYAINCHWSAKVEYQHVFVVDYDISGKRLDDGINETEKYHIEHVDMNSVRVGLNYRF